MERSHTRYTKTLCVMLHLNLSVVTNGAAVSKQTTKPMQYIPIAAVPMTNTRRPQTTLSHRGREGEFNDRATTMMKMVTAHGAG